MDRQDNNQVFMIRNKSQKYVESKLNVFKALFTDISHKVLHNHRSAISDKKT